MKRILSLVLILILSVGMLVACQMPQLPNFPFFGTTTTTTTTPTTPNPPASQYDVEAARDFISSMYVGWIDNNQTTDSYTVMTKMKFSGATFTITWSTNNELVVVTPDEAGVEATVTVPARGAEDVNYTLTGTVTAPDGTTAELSYDLVVPAFAINTYDEFIAAKNGENLTVTGVVTGLILKSAGWQDNGVYFQDENGGYYAYKISDEAAAQLKIGMTIMVSGVRGTYGTAQLTDPKVTIIDETIKAVEPTDYTEIFTNAADATDPTLIGKHNYLVTIKGVTVLEAGSNGYYYFELAGKKVYLRVSSSNNPCSKDDTLTLIANHAANYGNKADVTGIVSLYNGAFYLAPVSGDSFTNFTVVEKTPAEKVEQDKAALVIPNGFNADTTITVPVAGSLYAEDVVISWASNSDYIVVGENGQLTITVPEEKTVVTLTATLTCGDVTDTKEIEVTLNKGITSLKDAAALVDGSTVTIKGTVISIDTEWSEQYGNITVTIKDETGTFYIYRLKTNVSVGDILLINGKIGSYNGAKQLAAGATAEILGQDEPTQPEQPEQPKEEVAYIFGMTQGNLENKIYYLAGGMNGYYMETTTDASAALHVYLEETEGGYYFYCYVNGVKTYINMVVSGTHVNGAYEATPSTVHTLDSEKNTLIALVNGTEYWYGTRNDKTYTTMGPCAVSYAGFYGVLYPVEAGETPEPPAHEHEFVNGECACGEKDPNYVPPVEGGDDKEVAYIFGMTQGNLENKIYYLAGGMNGYYMETTTDASAALHVYLEETEGGYYFYCYVNGVKTYINMVVSGTHVNGAYEATPSTVHTLDSEKNTLIALVNGTEYWYGTRNDKTYTTMGPCAVSYAGFYGVLYPVEAGETPEPPAHEHEFVNGECACGEKDPNYVPPSQGGDDTTEGYTKVTSADQFTSGTYVIVVSTGQGLGKVDGTWITSTEGEIETFLTWTLEVNGSSVTIKDSNGVYVGPKGGNSNGIKTGTAYNWNWKINEDGTFTFTGTGSDTVTLAFNSDGQYYKFRGYKNTTVAGNPDVYPSTFNIYKVA